MNNKEEKKEGKYERKQNMNKKKMTLTKTMATKCTNIAYWGKLT